MCSQISLNFWEPNVLAAEDWEVLLGLPSHTSILASVLCNSHNGHSLFTKTTKSNSLKLGSLPRTIPHAHPFHFFNFGCKLFLLEMTSSTLFLIKSDHTHLKCVITYDSLRVSWKTDQPWASEGWTLLGNKQAKHCSIRRCYKVRKQGMWTKEDLNWVHYH